MSVILDQLVPRPLDQLPQALTLDEIIERARAIKPTARVLSSAVAKKLNKSDGTHRVVLSPGAKIRAAQDLVGELLECWSLINHFDYNVKGRGNIAAVREIIRQIDEDGARHFVIFDCKNFFTSVRPTHLGGVPLPRQVLMHVAYYNRNVKLLHSSLDAAEVEAARHGLPAGARLSGTLAASFLGREVRKVCGTMGLPVMYVDDVIIGGCDPAGARYLAETLRTRFSQHPGGPLSFKKIAIANAYDGFSYLGYWIKLVQHNDCGEKLILKPSHEAKMKMKRRLFEILKNLGKSASFDDLIARADSYLKSWRTGFSLWEPSQDALVDLEDEVHCIVGDFQGGLWKKYPCHGTLP